jgi:hypothetical protein
VAQKYRMAGGWAGERAGDSQLSPTPETFASGATFKVISGESFARDFFGGRMRSLCVYVCTCSFASRA